MWPYSKLRELENRINALEDEQLAHIARKTSREQVLKYWIPGIAALAVAVMAVGTGLHWFG